MGRSGMALLTARKRPIAEGLTLVELLVALLLASLLLVGVLELFSDQRRAYRAQVSTLTAQGNLGAAMEYLQSQLRTAGFGFGACGGEIRTPTAVLPALRIYNNYNLYRATADGTDSFAVIYASPGDGALRLLLPTVYRSTASVVVGPAPLDWRRGDWILLCAPAITRWATLLQLSGDPARVENRGAWRLPHASRAGQAHLPAGGYPAGTLVRRFSPAEAEARRFAIDNRRDPPSLVTWTLPDHSDLQVVTEGIEDMQLAWACDVDGDGRYAEASGPARAQDEWAHNVAGDRVPACGQAPMGLVRITLVARSPRALVSEGRSSLPAREDRRAAPDEPGGKGGYRRAVLTAQVRPRNLQ